jgi:hypothetical protein
MDKIVYTTSTGYAPNGVPPWARIAAGCRKARTKGGQS